MDETAELETKLEEYVMLTYSIAHIILIKKNFSERQQRLIYEKQSISHGSEIGRYLIMSMFSNGLFGAIQ